MTEILGDQDGDWDWLPSELNISEAIAQYEQRLLQGGEDPVTLTNYGTLLWRVFEFPRAASLFTRVIEDPRVTDPRIFRHIAKCYFEVGRFRESALAMQAAVQRTGSQDAVTVNTWAWALERDNQLDAAREQSNVALRIAPTYGPAVRLAAHLDRRSGDYTRAADRLRHHLADHSSSFDWGLRYELANVLDRLGQYEAAWQTLELAKSALRAETASYLSLSRQIRTRQWDLTRRISRADLNRWYAAQKDLKQTHRVCFLTGFPRSGTTLLEQLISAHPQALDTDESGILASQFISPMVWYAPDIPETLLEIRAWEAEQLDSGRELFLRFTENYLQTTLAGKLLVEKNPLLTADLPIALRLFPEASILFALRDPRDVIISYLFTMVPFGWTSAPAIDIREACRFYADTMRHWLYLRDIIPQPVHEWRYEDLISQPESRTRALAEFLGLEWNPAMLDDRQRSSRKAVRTPTYDDVTKPLYTRSLGRWQNYSEHLAPGIDLLRPFLDAWGYQ